MSSILQDSELVQVEEILVKAIEKSEEIIGINIGTSDGVLIAHKYNKNLILSDNEVSSYMSSILNISKNILENTLKRNLNYSVIRGKELIIISIERNRLILIAFVNKSYEDIIQVSKIVQILENIAVKINTLLQLPKIKSKDLFSLLKKSIPLVIWTAIITKEGLPIKVEANVSEAVVSGQLSHLFATSNLLLEGDIDSVILNGQEGHVIIHEIDKNRLLAIGVFEESNERLEVYLAKIKEIIEISKG